MKCPKCKSTDLKPTKLDDSLPVMGCTECDGASVSLLYYRDWAERTIPTEPDEQNAATEAAAEEITVEPDTATALSCPKCAKLMTKYTISSAHRNRIDLCGSCDEAWLDGSEWTLLKSLELAHKLPKVFTDQWQRKVRDQKMEALKVERLKNVVGAEATEKAVTFKTWLKDQEHKSAIVQFVGSD